MHTCLKVQYYICGSYDVEYMMIQNLSYRPKKKRVSIIGAKMTFKNKCVLSSVCSLAENSGSYDVMRRAHYGFIIKQGSKLHSHYDGHTQDHALSDLERPVHRINIKVCIVRIAIKFYVFNETCTFNKLKEYGKGHDF